VIPDNAIVTPNSREFEMLFGIEIRDKNKEIRIKNVGEMAKKYQLIIVLKGPETIVSNGDETIIVKGGSAGLTKGGTGDLIAGITTAMLSKNEPLLAAAAANFLVKKTAEDLEVERGLMFSIDDVVEMVPKTWKRLTTSA
jgi:NAD(P)H-hydrate epimerase